MMGSGLLAVLSCGERQSVEPTETVTTIEVMVSVIAPATDVLWAADNPQSDEDWAVLEAAARDIIGIDSLIKGDEGLVQHERARAAEPKWRAHNAQMMRAAQDALKSIENRDVDSLIEVGDQLYAPCESCHLEYYPQAFDL